MANKQALRELQSRLAERLQAARTEPLAQVVAGGRVRLRAASCFRCARPARSSPVAPMVPVPHSHRWFLGVANLRGHLHGVVDLAGFLGLQGGRAVARPGAPGRLQPGARHQLRAAGRPAVGPAQRRRADARCRRRRGARPSFAGARYRDASARVWQELNLAALARRRGVPAASSAERTPGATARRSERGEEVHMSFLNKIKGWGQKGAADHDRARQRHRRRRRLSPAAAARPDAARPTCRSPTLEAAAAFDAMPPARRRQRADRRRSSPRRCRPRRADFTETRLQGSDTGAAPLGAALPLIGDRPAAEQQRILLGAARPRPGRPDRADDPVVLVGRPRLGAGRRQRPGADAVAAPRQVGVAGAGRQRRRRSPRCKESADVLARNVRSLKTGDGSVAAAPVRRAGRARAGAAAGRPRREERRHRARRSRRR